MGGFSGYEDATSLVAALKAKRISSQELLQLYLARIEAHNIKTNAVVTLDADRAMSLAKQADEEKANGKHTAPMHGLPMTIKDTYETKGIRTTAGAKEYEHHMPDKDAIAVARLKSAGAIVFGKTNLPAYASDIQSFNDIFGTARNPYDPDKTTGGSSGGAAAALATALTPLELGSDLAGSIRVPAAFCGVYGHKPTHGLIPLQGHVPGPPGTLSGPDLAVAGPLARSPRDLELAMKILVGPDAVQSRAWKLSMPKARAKALKDFRIACWFDDQFCKVEASQVAAFEQLADQLEKAGASVDRKARPEFSLQQQHQTYFNLMATVAAAGMPEKTRRQLASALPFLKAGHALGKVHTDMVGYAKAVKQSAVEWITHNEIRHQFSAAWDTFFTSYDVLLTPAICSTAIEHNQGSNILARKIIIDGQTRSYLDLFVWPGLAGGCRLPATVAPVAMSASGLPIGVQIIAPYLEDMTSIAFAKALGKLIPPIPAPNGFN